MLCLLRQALLAPESVRLPARTQAVYVQNASKVLVAMCSTCSDDGELGRTLEMVPGRFRALMRSPHIEVGSGQSFLTCLLCVYVLPCLVYVGCGLWVQQSLSVS